MKKIIYSLILIFSINICNAQKEVGSVNVMGHTSCSISYYNELESYLFSFSNLKYSIISDYESFWIDQMSFNYLYKIMNENLSNKETTKIDVQLRKGTLKLDFKKGRVTFWLWDSVEWSYSSSYNKKQIDKLFGKLN